MGVVRKEINIEKSRILIGVNGICFHQYPLLGVHQLQLGSFIVIDLLKASCDGSQQSQSTFGGYNIQQGRDFVLVLLRERSLRLTVEGLMEWMR